VIKVASGPLLWFMNRMKFQGWTSLWGDIYFVPGFEQDAGLVRHEQTHLKQMQTDGKLVYMVKYFYWNIRYGYLLNPYEIEARAEQFKA
jgi:hypothetical protein